MEANAGTTVKAITTDEASASMMVSATGPNNLPSSPAMTTAAGTRWR
ncbi:hypothetical protein [Arthrobacter methylotrophus]